MKNENPRRILKEKEVCKNKFRKSKNNKIEEILKENSIDKLKELLNLKYKKTWKKSISNNKYVSNDEELISNKNGIVDFNEENDLLTNYDTNNIK